MKGLQLAMAALLFVALVACGQPEVKSEGIDDTGVAQEDVDSMDQEVESLEQMDDFDSSGLDGIDEDLSQI